MIDTIRLQLDKATFLDSFVKEKLIINKVSKGNKEIISVKLCETTSNKIIKGNTAYYNDELFQLDITSKYGFTDNNFARISIQCSLEKILLKNNTKYFNELSMIEALNIIQNQFDKIGIRTDIYKARLSRLDLYVDIETNYTHIDYIPIFTVFSDSRMKKRDDVVDTFYSGNKQHEFCIYDKTEEMRKRKIQGNKNITRIEYRLKNSKKIKSVFDNNSLEYLINNYNKIRDYFFSYVHDKLYRKKTFYSNGINVLNKYEEMKNYKNINKGYWLNKYFKEKGILETLNGSAPEMVINLIQAVDPSINKSRITNTIMPIYEREKISTMSYGKPKIDELYQELLLKFRDKFGKYKYKRNPNHKPSEPLWIPNKPNYKPELFRVV